MPVFSLLGDDHVTVFSLLGDVIHQPLISYPKNIFRSLEGVTKKSRLDVSILVFTSMICLNCYIRLRLVKKIKILIISWLDFSIHVGQPSWFCPSNGQTSWSHIKFLWTFSNFPYQFIPILGTPVISIYFHPLFGSIYKKLQ